MNAGNAQELYVYDHPESKIRFLEATLRGQDWRVRIAYPADDPNAKANIRKVREACDRKGYVLHEQSDAKGNNILELHHLGDGAKPGQVLSELGLVKGAGYLVTHPGITLDHVFEDAKAFGKKAANVMRDPARANGVIYLGAEAFLVSSGKDKTILQKIAYSFFLAQSAVYFLFAKNNNEAAFEQYRKKLDKTLDAGGSAESVHFEAQKDQESKGVLKNAANYIRRYPIQIGAALNDIGMGIYIVRSFIERNRYMDMLAKKIPATAAQLAEATAYTTSKGRFGISGFKRDIAGAIVSIVAWAFLLVTPKKHSEQEKEEAEGSHLSTAWQRFRENPQVGAGLLTLLSSGLRFSSALTTNDKRQAIGEGLYIGGDFELLFTKNDNYGSKNSKDVEVVARRVAEHIAGLPAVYGPEAQERVVEAMANFLRAKTLQEIKDNPHAVKYTLEELNQRREILVREVKLRIRNHQDERMERLADAANRITQFAPATAQAQTDAQMAQALSQLPWVHITPEEMRKAIHESKERKPPITGPKNERELREAIADLTEIVPRIDKGATASAVYDVVRPYLASTVSNAQPGTRISKPEHFEPLVTPAAALVH